MKFTKQLFLASLLTVVGWGHAHAQTNYYVSNLGDDEDDGKSKTTPWETIAKVNTMTFSPGDSILFKCGDVWRTPADASVIVSSSGTNDNGYVNYITYSSYGTGNKPLLLGSNKMDGEWTNVSGNIWKTEISYNSRIVGNGAEIFFELVNDSVAWGVQRTYSEDFSAFTQEYDWKWNDGYAYVYCDENPGTKYAAVEAPRTERIFRINNQENITVDGFEMAYSAFGCICDASNPGTHYGLKACNNLLHHIGIKNSDGAFGVSLKHSDMLIEYNDIHNCGRRNISINLYKKETTHILMENVTIRNNHLHDGWHTTGVDGINSGEHTMRDIYIYNNLIEDDKYLTRADSDRNLNSTSNSFYITADPWATSYNLYIYNNIIKNNSAKGMMIDGVDSLYVYNNSFCGVAQNVTAINKQNMIHCTDITSGIGEFEIVNNIFYNDAKSPNAPYANCVYIDYAIIDSARQIDYNLYYAPEDDSNGRLTNVFQSSPWVDEIYKANNFDDWKIYLNKGFDVNSPDPSDPLFVDMESDVSVQEGSPAIGAGKPVPWITTDYYGNERDPNNPTIGAIEYISDTSTAIEESLSSSSGRLVVAPNPTSGVVYVNCPDKADVSVFNLMGKRVYTQQCESVNSKLNYTFYKGLYIIKASTADGNIYTEKLVVE